MDDNYSIIYLEDFQNIMFGDTPPKLSIRRKEIVFMGESSAIINPVMIHATHQSLEYVLGFRSGLEDAYYAFGSEEDAEAFVDVFCCLKKIDFRAVVLNRLNP